MCVLSHLFVSDSFQPHGLQPTRLLCPRGFSRQEYWSGLPGSPPGDLPNQKLNPGLLHCRQILYSLSLQGSPGVHSAEAETACGALTLCYHLLLCQSFRAYCTSHSGHTPGSTESAHRCLKHSPLPRRIQCTQAGMISQEG